jgi:hypothetical protein
MPEEDAHEAPALDDDDVVPTGSTLGLILRVIGACLVVVAVSVAFLTRVMWLDWFAGEPVAWLGGIAGGAVFMTWLRWAPTRNKGHARRRHRLRNRYAR